MKINKIVKIKGVISIILLMVITWNCENVKEYKDPTDNTPPGKVTSVKVENLPGGAIISYTLPTELDLLGTKAVYSLREGGQIYEVFSSANNDTIILAGFSDTHERIVNLYTVDLSRNVSEAVPVTIKPLTPPIDLIRNSLVVQETFGGIYCEWDNILEEDIAVSLYIDSEGEWTLDDTFFSKASKGKFSFRGFENKEYAIRVEVRDRWMNYSIPLDTFLTPLFEEQIFGRDPQGRQLWYLWGRDTRECWSRGDIGLQDWDGYPFTRMFDLITGSAGDLFWRPGTDWGLLSNYIPGWPDDGVYAQVNYYTIDLGRADYLSRMRFWYRAEANFSIYTRFELWGTDSPKPIVPELTDEDRLTNLRYWTNWEEVNGTDEWKNDWVQFGDFVVELPSGATTYAAATSEDYAFLRAGVDFDFDPATTNVPYRYVRLAAKESIGSVVTGPGLQMRNNVFEIEFYGAYSSPR